jgi:hypothetical protein
VISGAPACSRKVANAGPTSLPAALLIAATKSVEVALP